jgi:uncharacterized membrane protein
MSESDSRFDGLNLLAALEAAGGLGLAAWTWRFGPTGPIPMHFDLSGHVNRWGDRTEAALVMGGLTLVLSLCYVMMAAMVRGQPQDAPTRRSLRIGRIIIMAVGALIGGLFTYMTFGGFTPEAGNAAPARLLPSLLALIFLVVGALLGKTSPNPFVGVRTYWSMKSRLAWDKSNRLAGRLFFWIGLLGLAASLVAPPAPVSAALIVAIIVAAAASIIESWRVWRSDPDRSFP